MSFDNTVFNVNGVGLEDLTAALELDINQSNEDSNQFKISLNNYVANKICSKLNISFDHYIKDKESYLKIYKLQNY